jgi:hypothetical protein
MLLLGFELGDRHHGANLSDLSRRFGIHPMTDIVGPQGHGRGKPYGIWMDFQPSRAQPHLLTAGFDRIRLRNVQTAMVEPGGHEWLRVGGHAVYRPAGEHTSYRDGQLTQPTGGHFEINTQAAWIPVGVDAPTGLTYPGSVRFLGTWDLLRAPDDTMRYNALQLLERLLDWLADAGNS